MDENSSDTTSSVEHVLMSYKKKMKEDFISNSLSIESLQNSNINININMPSTSENAEFSLRVQSGATTKNRKRNVKKKTKQIDSPVPVINVEDNSEMSTSKKSNKKTSKAAGSKSSKRVRSNESDPKAKDPDYKPSAEPNYLRLSSKELNSIAKRVRIFHETGIVVSDDEDIIGCKNKYKKGNKKNQPRQQGEQVPGTQFGQGRVGTICGGYGAKRCTCCNVPKNNNSILNFCSAHPNTNLSQEILNSIKHREERLLQLQQQELLRHPEFADIGDDDDDEQHIETPEFSKDKRAWVQKFIDSMSADRVDYEKPRQANIVAAVEQKRPSLVVSKQDEDDILSSIDNKTIVERVDFKKKHSGGRQRTIDEWLRGCSSTSKSQSYLPIATSTPRQAVNSNLNETYMSSIPGPSNINANAMADTELTNKIEDSRKEISSKVERDIFKDIISTNIDESLDDIVSIDISHLDRSNITLRTPCSKSISYRNNPSSSKPIFEENNDIMDFVDNLLSQETETINQEVNERCEKWLEDNRRNQDLLQNALDSVIVINDDDIPHTHDDSVEIISDYPEHIPVNSAVNSVVVLEDDDSVIPVISINDSRNPSTSRSTRGRRKLTRKRGMRRQVQPAPPTQPSTFVKPVEAVSSVEQPNEERDIKPENRGLRDCPICLENMENKEISATICGHIFCTSCITAAVRSNRSCPNCRTALTLKKIHPLFI